MQYVIRWIGGGLQKITGISKVESLCAAANIFVGQSESPLVIRPYLAGLKPEQLFCVMTVGMAGVAGTILAAYASMGIRIDYLLAAAFMSAPGGILMAKIMMPDEPPLALAEGDPALANPHPDDEPVMVHDDGGEKPANIIMAAAQGAQTGVRLAVAVGAMVLTPRGRPQYCSPYMVERSDPDGFRSIGLHRDRHFDADDPAINQACEVPWYPTTCLMVRPACFADHDPFDEGFAIAEEDKDLCLSLRRAGYRILYNSDSRVCHNGYPRDPDYAAIRENLKLLHQDRRRLEMKWSCSVVNEASRGFLEQSGVTPQQIARYERFPLFMRVVP
jgi:hypothetical protein